VGIVHYRIGAPAVDRVHFWDYYHSVMNVKYFKELGYYDLYRASVYLDYKTHEKLPEKMIYRDLYSYYQVNIKDVKEKDGLKDSIRNFSPRRRAQFVVDMGKFYQWVSSYKMQAYLMDKGYNGTPFWTWLVTPLIKLTSVSLDDFVLLSWIDVILVLVSILALWRVFGKEVALLSFIGICVFEVNHSQHMTGSLMRFDYLAAIVLGLCSLRRNQQGLAGVFFSYAFMVRIFPILFFAGYVLRLIFKACFHPKLRRDLQRKLVRICMSFVVTTGILFGLSLFNVRGFSAWTDFYNVMQVHNSMSSSSRIGLKNLFCYSNDVSWFDPLVDYAVKRDVFQSRSPGYYFLVSILVLMLFYAVLCARDDTEAVLFFFFFTLFLFVNVTRYYYVLIFLIFLLKPLRERKHLISLTCVLMLLLWLIHSVSTFQLFIYNYWLSFMFFFLYLYWIFQLFKDGKCYTRWFRRKLPIPQSL
jgi:hypothetical protein